MKTNEATRVEKDAKKKKVSFGLSLSVEATRKALQLIPITIFAFIIIKFWIMPRFWELWTTQGEEITADHILKNMWFSTAALSVINLIISKVIEGFITITKKDVGELVVFYFILLSLLNIIFFVIIILNFLFLENLGGFSYHSYVGLLFYAPVMTTVIVWVEFLKEKLKKN